MCSVSAVTEYYTQPRWPSLIPGVVPSIIQNDPEVLRLLREAIERLDKIDKRLGDIECNDEAKEKFLRSLGYPYQQAAS